MLLSSSSVCLDNLYHEVSYMKQVSSYVRLSVMRGLLGGVCVFVWKGVVVV